VTGIDETLLLELADHAPLIVIGMSAGPTRKPVNRCEYGICPQCPVGALRSS
jgi:hypothetical protein